MSIERDEEALSWMDSWKDEERTGDGNESLSLKDDLKDESESNRNVIHTNKNYKDNAHVVKNTSDAGTDAIGPDTGLNNPIGNSTGTTTMNRTGTTSVNRTGTTAVNRNGATTVNRTGATTVNRTGATTVNRTGATTENGVPIDEAIKENAPSVDTNSIYGMANTGSDEDDANTINEPEKCISRASNCLYYKIVAGLVASLILIGLVTFAVVAQKSKNLTSILRVQFQEGTGLNQYSGCFEINDYTSFSRRHTYNSLSGTNSLTFGYCKEKHQWILFDDWGDTDPCETRSMGLVIARSSKTDSFDISTSFDETWFSSINAPLGLYFFDDYEEEIDYFCSSTLGDGICDLNLNHFGYSFDGGDCCAATCTKPNCGRGGLATSVFGNRNSSGDGFPNCKNPEMVPITIRLNGISSSRDPQFAEFDDTWKGAPYRLIETEWRTATPENPYFALDCNGKNVLTVYIEQTMVNNSETVMVEDGANCTLVVRNMTTHGEPNLALDYPIWFIDYTVFHGRHDYTENENVEILSQSSSEKERTSFKRIPDCYFGKLRNDIDLVSIYTALGPSNEAIAWLVQDSTENSQCEDDEFIERYALVTMMFAMGRTQYVNFERQCTWPMIACSEGKVTTINLDNTGLMTVYIPSEIHLLPSLKELRIAFNQISSIPTEIATMTNLQTLNLGWNQISSIPTEFGLMTNLQTLNLDSNQITSIPTEFGLMTSLRTLYLKNHIISSFPTEIQLLTNLEVFENYYDPITSIPTEIAPSNITVR